MKTKRKFFPANTADIPALESWLEDMALEGLFPLSFNGYYAKFRQGEPQKMTYRIEVPKYVQAEPPKTMRETYEDFGWQFVCHMWQKYYLFSSAEECPIEPHTDPLVQSRQLEEAHQERACVRSPYGAQKKLSESRFYPAAAGTADGANQLYAVPLNLFR